MDMCGYAMAMTHSWLTSRAAKFSASSTDCSIHDHQAERCLAIYRRAAANAHPRSTGAARLSVRLLLLRPPLRLPGRVLRSALWRLWGELLQPTQLWRRLLWAAR